MVPYFLSAGLGLVRTGVGGWGMQQEPRVLGFSPQALLHVGFALDSVQFKFPGGLLPPHGNRQAAL